MTGSSGVAAVAVTLALMAGPPPATKEVKVGRPDPYNATGKLFPGGSAVVVGPRRKDGKWDVLTAWHCVKTERTKTMFLRDGRKVELEVSNSDVYLDVTLMSTKSDKLDDLAYVLLADKSPGKGTKVWSCGYGISTKGLRRYGVLNGRDPFRNYLQMTLNVDNGDSGSGLFDEKNRLIGIIVRKAGPIALAVDCDRVPGLWKPKGKKDANAKAKTKVCPCSDQCVCGCNNGLACTCPKAVPLPPRTVPAPRRFVPYRGPEHCPS